MEDSEIEIYRQRYETFRHLDKLRWQMLQLLVAVASATALVLRSSKGPIEWWFYSLLGFSLVVISVVMMKIGTGIRTNSQVLKRVASNVGDTGIPDVSSSWRSVAHWLSVSVCIIGSALLVRSFFVVIGSGD